MTKLLAWLVSLGMVVTPIPQYTAEVDRTEDNNMVVVLVYEDKGDRTDYYQFDIPQEDFNEFKNGGEDLAVDVAVGTFSSNDFMMTSPDGVKEKFYQFKSYDDEVWWCLTEDEIGFVPKAGKSYALVLYQNGTTKDNHECPPEYECDCYCYDDIYLGVYGL